MSGSTRHFACNTYSYTVTHDAVRCLTHLAVGDYDPAEPRHMLRTSLLGEYVGRLLNPPADAAPAPKAAQDLAVAISNAHD